jgi:hypothetical protein
MTAVDYSTVADQVFEFRFATDSERGVFVARDFAEAKMMLAGVVTDEAIGDGGWGWVDDQDGNRFWIAKENNI